MSDRKLLGPVKTLKTETATWDAETQEWQPSQHFTITAFHRDGKVKASDTHNHDGSVAHVRCFYDSGRLAERHTWMNDDPIYKTLYLYDQAGRHLRTTHQNPDGSRTDTESCTYDSEGRMTKTISLHLPKGISHRDNEGKLIARSIGYSIEGTDLVFRVPGADGMTTTYNKENLPTKVIFQNQDKDVLKEVRFERDDAGRVAAIEVVIGESQFEDFADGVSPDRREAMAAVFRQVFGQSFSHITYSYDSRGRLLERTDDMGTLKSDRKTYQYDDHHDEPITETSESHSRTANVDDEGVIHYQSDKMTVQHNRFEYQYDNHGNWIERIVSYQIEPDAGFQRSNVERRTITYHT